MTDKAVTMQATLMFGLGATFHAQSSSDNALKDYAQVLDANGDAGGGCESGAMNSRNEYSCVAQYCGSTIRTALGTLLTTFGEVADSKAVDEITIVFKQDAQPEVTINGHNHTDNAHAALANADVSALIPDEGGVGVPDFVANSNTDATPTSLTFRISLTHVDKQDADNKHWVGENQNFRVDVTAEYLGVPVLTLGSWVKDSDTTNDANTDFDTYSISAHQFIVRN